MVRARRAYRRTRIKGGHILICPICNKRKDTGYRIQKYCSRSCAATASFLDRIKNMSEEEKTIFIHELEKKREKWTKRREMMEKRERGETI